MHFKKQESAWPPQQLVRPVSAGVVLLVAAIVGASVWLDSTRDAGENTGIVPSVRGTPSPATSDSPWSVLEEAEVVHLVYASGGNETTEVWIDRVSGDAIQKRTDATGAVVAVSQREGLTLTEYHLMFEQPSLTTRTVLEADDPTLLIATLQLEGYRYGLDTGGVTRVAGGRTEYDGQPVIEVHAWPGGELEHVALLDPVTLFPLAMFTPGGEPMPLTYSLIEGLERDAVDRSVFAFDFGNPMYVETYELLTADAATAFSEYPVSSLGDEFAGLTLERVERQQAYGSTVTSERDQVAYYYRQSDDDDTPVSLVTVENRPALTAAERADLAIAEVNSSIDEASLSSGETVRVHIKGSDGRVGIEIDRPEGYIFIHAPNRDTGLRAAEALLRVNGEHFPVD